MRIWTSLQELLLKMQRLPGELFFLQLTNDVVVLSSTNTDFCQILNEFTAAGRPNVLSIRHTLPHNANASVPTRGIIICPTIHSIPCGRQAAKILKCGIPGCIADKLFDRKYELERHMKGHGGRHHPCTQDGCSRTGNKAFARSDKLREHMRKLHGM